MELRRLERQIEGKLSKAEIMYVRMQQVLCRAWCHPLLDH